MVQLTITLLTLDKARRLCNILTAYPIDADVQYGSYVVDAKSLMGILGLDLSRELQLILHTDNPAISDSIISALKKDEVL